MPDATAFDPPRLLATLNQHGVRYVVIGGIAAAAGGVSWTTFDLDIVIATTEENLSRLTAALAELDAEYDTPHFPPIRPDLRRLSALSGPQLFRTRHGRLDVLKEAAGETFESLARDAHIAELEGFQVNYASLPVLLRLKRAANRPKDQHGARLIEAALHANSDEHE